MWLNSDADTCRFEWCVIEHASEPGYGGVFWQVGSPLVLRHSTFRLNSVPTGYAGVAFIYYAYLDISNCVFESNTALEGGAFNIWEADGLIQDCIFRGNCATVSGGGAVVFDAQHYDLVVRRCDFVDNNAIDGGAVYLQTGDTSLVFQECRFFNNGSANSGGAVGSQVNRASARFEDCVFDSNWTNGIGGGLHICHTTVVDRCIITHNSAQDGGGIYAEPSGCGLTPMIRRSTLVGNSAQGAGGGIYLDVWATVQACVVAYSSDGEGIRVPQQGVPASERPSYDLVFGNSDGDFSFNEVGYGAVEATNVNGDSCDTYYNIFLDPQFVDMAAGDYHLTAGSPCIDAGDPALDPDPDGTIADMGAFYFHQLAAGEERTAVQRYELHQNYPNPFNAQTRIAFELAQAGEARLDVFDITGRLVQTLARGPMSAGSHEVLFDAGDLPSGVYLYRLSTGTHVEARKMILLR